MTGACTIVSPNYLAYAQTLSASYLEQHPSHRFFVLIVADLPSSAKANFDGKGFTPVILQEIGLEDLRREAMKYDILELNTNVKPTFMKHLISTYSLEKLVYLDPDIFVYAPLAPVFEALDQADAVLTPHITQPILDDKEPGEQDFLYNGTYNLGFFALRRSDEGLRILDWWEKRCLSLGFSEGRTGLFVDQKWMNLLPGLFEKVAILRHPGLNMAYWSLHERILSKMPDGYVVNATYPLCFFHFSGLTVDDPSQLSKNTNRFQLSDRPDLTQLFADYRAAVIGNRLPVLEAIPYGFDTLSDGTVVTRLARRLYAKHQLLYVERDPFDATGPFARFARAAKLLAGKEPPAKATWREFSGTDRRVEMVHRALRMTLLALGPNRYELLMRYLSHITVLRNQSVFLKPD